MTALKPDRIRHGIAAVGDPDLLAELADKQIVLDVCPTSNLRTKSVGSLAEHPLPALIAAGVSCTVNTDDPAMFGTDLGREHAIAHRLGVGPKALFDAGLQGAQCDQATKAALQAIGAAFDWAERMTPRRAGLDKQPAEVAAMFDEVARRYDLVNDVLSLGQDRVWRRAVAKAVDARSGERVLDLAAGTGTSSASFVANGATCIACDFSLGMVRQGARQRGGAGVGGVRFVAGDALALPFADATFDAVTISFGLRNVHDVGAALRELLRVTRPGGRIVICEFSTPTWPPFRRLYAGYLARVPAVVKRVSPTPTPTSTWPNRSANGRHSLRSPTPWRTPGGRRRVAKPDRWHRGAAPRLQAVGARPKRRID